MTNRTKIVATIGPASCEPAVLRQLIDAGVNVFRLNFSHGTHEQHSAVLADIRALSRESERHVAVLQDLCGPKMRLEPFAGDVLECRLEDEFTLVTEPTADGGRELPTMSSRCPEARFPMPASPYQEREAVLPHARAPGRDGARFGGNLDETAQVRSAHDPSLRSGCRQRARFRLAGHRRQLSSRFRLLFLLLCHIRSVQ